MSDLNFGKGDTQTAYPTGFRWVAFSTKIPGRINNKPIETGGLTKRISKKLSQVSSVWPNCKNCELSCGFFVASNQSTKPCRNFNVDPETFIRENTYAPCAFVRLKTILHQNTTTIMPQTRQPLTYLPLNLGSNVSDREIGPCACSNEVGGKFN